MVSKSVRPNGRPSPLTDPTTEIDIEGIARAVENDPGPKPMEEPPRRLGPDEAKTKGPVIIDTRTGLIRDAETNAPVASFQRDDESQREIDYSLIAVLLLASGAILFAAAAIAAPFTPSQKIALVALDSIVLAERVWFELRRNIPTVEPEGVIYESQIQNDLPGR